MKNLRTHVATPGRRRVALGAAAALVAAGVGGSLLAAHADAAAISSIVLGVGSDQSARSLSWYASSNSAQSVQVVPTSKLKNGGFPTNGISTVPATVVANSVNGGFNGKAVIDHLGENTSYSYRVGANGAWSPTYSFKTKRFHGDFDFLFFGDPQIGSSGDTNLDGAGWLDTVNVATAATPNAELLVGGGDQVETANTEAQWNQFLAPDKLRQIPYVATIGNHDVGGKAYEQHFNTPNTDRSAPFYTGATASGGDYWFIYKDVLFVDINSNALAGDAAHINFVTSAVNAHGKDAKYTVLVYHHSIYSPADHANDSDNKTRRVDFPTAFSNLGVDLVLQGHDHSYSRSYLIKNGQKANPAEQPGAMQVQQGPGGVVYVTGNSASGSKYYDLTAPSTTDPNYGPDPLNPAHHFANSVENQEHVRSYVKIAVRDRGLVVQDIRSGTCATPNAALERGNVHGCGPTLDPNGVGALPVGSTVDQVVIHRYTPAGRPNLLGDLLGNLLSDVLSDLNYLLS